MAGVRVHVVMSRELVERIDGALVEGVSRGEFVRRAVEQALAVDTQLPSPAGRSGTIASGVSPSPAGSASARGASGPSAPAEPPPRSQPDRPLSSVLRPARSFVRKGSGPIVKGKG